MAIKLNLNESRDFAHFLDNTIERQVKAFGDNISIVSILDNGMRNWDTSLIQDVWLTKNCDLDFIQDKLKEKYSTNPLFFSQLSRYCDFSINGISIEKILSADKNVCIDFWNDSENGQIILDEQDEICVYGTTYFFKVLNNVKNYLKGEGNVFQGNIWVNYYGMMLFVDEDNRFNHVGGRFNRIGLDGEFKLPKIHYSFDLNDLERFPKEFVFVSTDYEIFALFNTKNTKEMIKSSLPNYLLTQLKNQ